MRGRIYKAIAYLLEQVRKWIEQGTEFNEMDRQMLQLEKGFAFPNNTVI
jgi:hypothetical protein